MFSVFVRYSNSAKKGRVNIGMFRFQTIYSSLDVRRTKCVGQSIFSVMTPVPNAKTIAVKTLETSDDPFRCQNAGLTCWCFKCLSAVVKLVEKGGVSIGMLETRNLSFDVRRTECVGQNIFPMMTPVSRWNNKTTAGKTMGTSDPLSKCVFYKMMLYPLYYHYIMEKGGVNMGMFPSRYFQWWLQGKNIKTFTGKRPTTADHLSSVKMHVECADVQFMLFILPKVMEQRGWP